MHTRDTKEFPVAPVIVLPMQCITASTLRSLASTLDRIESFHKLKGGASEDTPCLTHVFVDDRDVFARIRSGTRSYKLQLVQGAWEFR
jgi:hypothetical protein